MSAIRPAAFPPIDAIDRFTVADFVTTMAPLFEGAPSFLRRLAGERPFGSADELFARARALAHRLPLAEQIELIDAHPRLGAPPIDISALSFIEQGYDREAADIAANDAAIERRRVAGELDRLNAAYEARFGFRYCVFVGGRPRHELLPGFAAALEADRAAELTRALDAVVDIAHDRANRLGNADPGDRT